MHKLLIAIVCIFSLTACSSEYIISTTDGQLLTTSSKPKLDEKSGMYRFEDSEGRDQQVEKTTVKQILER